MNILRSFIALEISNQTKDVLKDAIVKFKKSSADIKWVRPDNLHITLKFLGNINEADVTSISGIIKECSADIKPFDLSIEGVGGFPSLIKPRVIFVEIRKEISNLSVLFARLNDKLSSFGIKKETRKYLPHLTIGRVRSLKKTEGLSGVIEEYKAKLFGEERVDSIALMMSELLPGGAKYTRLDSLSLKN